MVRSIPGFSVIGAQPRRSSDLSGIVHPSPVVGDGRVEPGLELATATANVRGQFGPFHVEKREQLREGEFIEVKKRERTALRLGGGRDPERELRWLELPDLGGGGGRYL